MSGAVWHEPVVSRAARWERLGLRGGTVWLTGLSGSGKSTIGHALDASLTADGVPATVLDADNLRHGLNADLGFSDGDRRENVRRTAEVARLFAEAGTVAIVPIISPFADGRDAARSIHARDGLEFWEVWVSTPLEECERRDTKGLYAKARSGELRGLSGLDAPYEAPAGPDLVLGRGESVDEAVAALRALIGPRGAAH
ncbi:MAG: adenylyl-sulfate kinase [Actinobacteria bacterium]|nr:adenylyl-sulfate kinase [Actinomycetota bacterium]